MLLQLWSWLEKDWSLCWVKDSHPGTNQCIYSFSVWKYSWNYWFNFIEVKHLVAYLTLCNNILNCSLASHQSSVNCWYDLYGSIHESNGEWWLCDCWTFGCVKTLNQIINIRSCSDSCLHVGCRYAVMLRSTFWKCRRVAQMNTYLPLDQKGRLLIHILKKPQKMVKKIKIDKWIDTELNAESPFT